MTVKILDQRTLYQGKVFRVTQEKVVYPNGHQSTLDIIHHPGAVVIVPVDASGQFWFIRQYRHAAGKEIFEFPAGTMEENEPPLDCARREIREEIGMAASTLIKIGEFYIAPGYTTEFLFIYLAKDLTYDPLSGDDDELIVVQKVPIDEAYSMADAGSIIDAKTLAALMLVRPYLVNNL